MDHDNNTTSFPIPTLNGDPLYRMDSDGWAYCSRCGSGIRGLNAEATLRVMALHLLKHGIKVEAPATTADGIGTPTFIPERRNGSGILQSIRTDYTTRPRNRRRIE